MTTPVLLYEFSATEPFTVDKLNVNFQALVSTVNALAAEQVAQFGLASPSAQYLGIAGGTLLGQLAAPSILVGPDGGTKYPVVTTNDAATTATRGAVKQGAAVASLGLTAGVAYSQAQMQAVISKLDELLSAMRVAGLLAT